jgi:uncharacterized membrane protein YhaH (DUF805 family)
MFRSSISLFFVNALVIYFFASMLPFYAAAVRRMHDTNHEGWFIFVPGFNIILLLSEGINGPNSYGDDPKKPNIHGETSELMDFDDIYEQNH